MERTAIILKDATVESDRAWKGSGRPRNGTIFLRQPSCRVQYRRRFREKEKSATEIYTNDLHAALLQKRRTAFWQCWPSKLESKKYLQPSGWYCRSRSYCTKFALHFKTTIRWSNPNIVTFLSSHTFSIVIAIVVRLSMIRISFIRNLLVESYVNYSEVKH